MQNVRNASPAFAPNTVKELIALAKARPGAINYASAGPGSASHFSGLLFIKMIGVDIMHVPYKGGAPAIAAVLSGEAAFNFGPMPATVALIKSGHLKAIAVRGSTRSSALPEVPTVSEAGVPGYSSVGWFGLMAPKGTPKTIVTKLNATVETAITPPEVARQLQQVAADVAATTPEKFGEFVKEEFARYGKLIPEAGIKIE